MTRWLVLVACACSAKPASKHRDDAAMIVHPYDEAWTADAAFDAMDTNWGKVPT